MHKEFDVGHVDIEVGRVFEPPSEPGREHGTMWLDRAFTLEAAVVIFKRAE